MLRISNRIVLFNTSMNSCCIRFFCDKRRNCSRNIYNHFLKNGQVDVLDLFPKELKRATTKKEAELYIADPNVANQIANAISQHHLKEVPFFEFNPGPCILTKALLQQLKLNKLGLIESREPFVGTQENFKKSHQLGKSLKLKYSKRHFYNDTANFIRENTKESEWHENIICQLFMNLQPSDIYRLINDVIEQKRLFASGRVEIFGIIPSYGFMKIAAEPESKYWLYTQKSCIFQILFEYEVLAQIRKESFLPWWNLKPAYGGKVGNDANLFYLVRIVPKKDLFSVCKPDDFPLLRFFIYQCFFRRKAYIIPKLEQWIPGIGVNLITSSFDRQTFKPNDATFSGNMNKSFHVFRECGSLTPVEIFALFQFFQSSPKYETSCFHQQCTNFYKINAKSSESMQKVAMSDDENLLTDAKT